VSRPASDPVLFRFKRELDGDRLPPTSRHPALSAGNCRAMGRTERRAVHRECPRRAKITLGHD